MTYPHLVFYQIRDILHFIRRKRISFFPPVNSQDPFSFVKCKKIHSKWLCVTMGGRLLSDVVVQLLKTSMIRGQNKPYASSKYRTKPKDFGKKTCRGLYGTMAEPWMWCRSASASVRSLRFLFVCRHLLSFLIPGPGGRKSGRSSERAWRKG